MSKSKIEWTDHGLSPWQGCTAVSAGCAHCYAETWDRRHMRSAATHWGATAPRLFASDAYMATPLAWNRAAKRRGERRSVFVAPMCDIFECHRDPSVAARQQEYRERVYALVETCTELDWRLLTKRPENIHEMISRRWPHTWPSNVTFGVSVEHQEAAERIPTLLDLHERYRAVGAWLSCEPLLGPIDMIAAAARSTEGSHGLDRLRWVIAGSESGPGARPAELDWFRSLRDQCSILGVPYFFKQYRAPDERKVVSLPMLDGQQWAEFPRSR